MANYEVVDSYPIDARGAAYSIAYFSAKHLGAGQYYLMTVKDSNGKPFEGSKLYKLHLPANVPVKLYWSITLYDRETHAVIKSVPLFSSRAHLLRPVSKKIAMAQLMYILVQKLLMGNNPTGYQQILNDALKYWPGFTVPKRDFLIRHGKWEI